MAVQSVGRLDRSVLAAVLVAAGTLLCACESQHAGPARPAPAPAPAVSSVDGAWEVLQAGNSRYVSGRLLHPDQSVQRRAELAAGQHPRAVVLACSDSRVPPEIVFDTGLGDLFVVRVAGNTDVPAAVGSIEYAVEHLHVPLIVVLGHQSCGAVEAAVKADKSGERAPGELDAILAPIAPAVKVAKGQPGDINENAMQDNVALVVERLRTSEPILAEAVRSGKLKIMGCRYDLESGKVSVVGRVVAATRE